MPFHRVGGDVHVSGDLPPGPPLGGEHGHGKFRGGQAVCHIMARVRVIDVPPAPGEAVGHIQNLPQVLRPVFLKRCFQHSAHEAVVFAKALDKTICQCGLLGKGSSRTNTVL